MHIRFIYRQIVGSVKQTAVFIACVTLSLVTLISLGGFGESVNNSLLRDARKLLAADLIVESRFPYREPLTAELDRLRTAGYRLANVYEFASVVRLPDGEQTLLSELKVVEAGYPFYGKVGLQSGRSLAEVLVAGEVVVAQNLLDRLALAIGDEIIIGQLTLTIADVVLSEPDQPIDFFRLGPRVFVAADDLAALDLIKPGSLVRYKTLIQVPDESELDGLFVALDDAAEVRQEQVDTFRTNQSAVQNFFEDLLSFLNLIGIFTLMLAGIGIQSSLTAFLKERENTIAIMRTFGATSGFVIRQFFAVAAILGIIGTLLGIVLGIALQFVFPVLFAPFLPPQVEFILSGRAIGEGVLLGLFVVVAFTFLPIYQVQELKPIFILRKESLPLPKGGLYYTAVALIFLFFSGMVYWYLQNPERTLYFAGGVVGLIALTSALTQGILWWLRRFKIKPLAMRQALRGLFRPRNSTAAIVVTLATSLAVLFTIYLIERNLDASFLEAYPEDAPNLFVLDIQPDQVEGVAELLGQENEFFPFINARIKQINDTAIEQREYSEEEEFDDGPARLERNFAITYRDQLRENESLVTGETLFLADEIGMAQVSVSDDMLTAYQFELGDVLVFDIQGVRLSAQVVSLRHYEQPAEGGFAPPSLEFVFRPIDLQNAPQTIVTSATIPPAEIPALQNEMVAAFPNLTVVDVTIAIDTLAELVGNITIIIRFFTLFSIFAGVLIIISSVLATRFARIQEAVYFKVLGAKRRFVLRVFTLENVFIGLVSAFLALLLSQFAGWLLVTQVFELAYRPYLGSSLGLVVFTVGLVTTVGLLASVSILNKKPIIFLREQSDE